MERAIESSIAIFTILTILYLVNSFANLIDIPPIFVGIGLALFAVVFVLRAVFWKKNRNKVNNG